MYNLAMQRYKTALIGEINAGKTTLAHYLSLNEFVESKSSTIGAAFHPIKYNQKTFELWDTSGQEKFSELTSLYYRNAGIMILVFDASNCKFENKLKYYLDETKIKANDGNEYKIIIVCNKIDLVDKTKLVELKKRVNEIVNMSQSKFNVVDYLEVSCKNKIGRNAVMEKIDTISNEQCEKRRKVETEYSLYGKDNKNVIVLDYNNPVDKEKSQGCCF